MAPCPPQRAAAGSPAGACKQCLACCRSLVKRRFGIAAEIAPRSRAVEGRERRLARNAVANPPATVLRRKLRSECWLMSVQDYWSSVCRCAVRECQFWWPIPRYLTMDTRLMLAEGFGQ